MVSWKPVLVSNPNYRFIFIDYYLLVLKFCRLNFILVLEVLLKRLQLRFSHRMIDQIHILTSVFLLLKLVLKLVMLLVIFFITCFYLHHRHKFGR